VEVVGFNLRVRVDQWQKSQPMAAIPWIAFPLRTRGKKNNFHATETREHAWCSGLPDSSRPLIFCAEHAAGDGRRASVGKVNDTVTVSDRNLGKTQISAVFLSDDKNDYKATVVEQTRKNRHENSSGQTCQYNVSIQVGDKLF